jgi:hypothetical protein
MKRWLVYSFILVALGANFPFSLGSKSQGDVTAVTPESVIHNANDERLWISSMPCSLPSDENIPLGRFGTPTRPLGDDSPCIQAKSSR